MIKLKIQFPLILLLSIASVIIASPAEGKTYSLIISGINRDGQDKMTRTGIILDLQSYLIKTTHANSETIKVLTSDDTGDNSSKFSNIKKVMANYESAIKPEDTFVLYYTGQANVINQKLRFNLPGEDITEIELGQMIKKIKSNSMLIILDCPASGLAVKELSAKGRIIVCSCTDEQRFNIKFGEYFVSAWDNIENDIDSDGKISVLEAFISTSKNIQDWYEKEKLLMNETPVLDDNGDGKPSKEPWLYVIDMKDGLAASNFFIELE